MSPPCFSALTMSGFDPLHAGKAPKTSAAATATDNANAKTRASGAKPTATVSGRTDGSSRAVQNVNTYATTPPPTAMMRLSVKSCRITRPRFAPIATRTPISRTRAEPRTRSRFARLAQVMSKTRTTAPIRIPPMAIASARSAGVSPMPGTTANPSRPRLVRCSARNRSATTASSALASAAVLPSRKRPNIRRKLLPRISREERCRSATRPRT